MALLVIASGPNRLLARRMRGYADAQARQIFRDLVDTPADVTISESAVHARFHRRAHLPDYQRFRNHGFAGERPLVERSHLEHERLRPTEKRRRVR